MTTAIPVRPDAASAKLGPYVQFDDDLRASIRGNFSRFSVRRGSATSLQEAAVSICIVPNSDRFASVLLTLRPPSLNRHAGQYALPGGRLDTGESNVDAALRELHEELNLSAGPGSVLGQLDDFETASGYCIAPLVLWVADTDSMKPAPDEVAQIFHIPLSELLSPDIPHIAKDTASGDMVMSAPLRTIGHHVFAPTAAILHQFREVALLGRNTRVADAGQPEFARR